MSSRKKWRLKLMPSFRYAQASSKVDAYRKVDMYRREYALGWHVHGANVEVDEGNGWALYERVIFPERDA